MPRLEESQTGCGLASNGLATVTSFHWYGGQVAEMIYDTAAGNLDKRLVCRNDELGLAKLATRRPEHEPEQTSFP